MGRRAAGSVFLEPDGLVFNSLREQGVVNHATSLETPDRGRRPAPPEPLLLPSSSVDDRQAIRRLVGPVNLGKGDDSPFEEFFPELSKSGCSLYFSSNRPGPFGGEDLGVPARGEGRPVGAGQEPWRRCQWSIQRALAGTLPRRASAFSRALAPEDWAGSTSGCRGAPTRAMTSVAAAGEPGGRRQDGAATSAPSYSRERGPRHPTLFFASSRPGIGGVYIYRSERTPKVVPSTGRR